MQRTVYVRRMCVFDRMVGELAVIVLGPLFDQRDAVCVCVYVCYVTFAAQPDVVAQFSLDTHTHAVTNGHCMHTRACEVMLKSCIMCKLMHWPK